jgi:hypothetical protein
MIAIRFADDESACQPGSSFGAAPVQHFTASLGGHAFPESVVSHPTKSAGLKRSFHDCTSFTKTALFKTFGLNHKR